MKGTKGSFIKIVQLPSVPLFSTYLHWLLVKLSFSKQEQIFFAARFLHYLVMIQLFVSFISKTIRLIKRKKFEKPKLKPIKKSFRPQRKMINLLYSFLLKAKTSVVNCTQEILRKLVIFTIILLLKSWQKSTEFFYLVTHLLI